MFRVVEFRANATEATAGRVGGGLVSFAMIFALAGLVAAPISAEDDHGHHDHAAPHGGTLVVFGDEVAHVEFVVDEENGEITAYVLDGEAERGVAVQQASLTVVIEPASGPDFEVALSPVENVLTGETRGNTSQFSGRSPKLEGLHHFHGEIRTLEIKGQRFEDVAFRFPEGNEDHAHPAEKAP